MRNISTLNIHVLRGLAALLVVVFHSKFVLWCGGNKYLANVGLHSIADYFLFGIDMLTSCGHQAVIIFFLLSSFVITHSLKKTQSIWLYIKIRLARIYIPYIASLILSTVALFFCYKYLIPSVCDKREYLARLTNSYNERGIATFVKSLFFIRSKEYSGFNFAYWSLLHEAIYYFFAPIYIKLKNKQLVVIGLIIGLLSFLFKIEILYYHVFFIIGTLLYNVFYLHQYKISISKKISFLLLFIVFALINVSVKMGYDVVSDFLSIVFYILAIDVLLNYEFKMPKILNSLSNQSYSLYLFHLPILMLYLSVLTHVTKLCEFTSRVPYYTGVIIAVVVNIPLYYLFEYQSLKIIAKLKK